MKSSYSPRIVFLRTFAFLFGFLIFSLPLLGDDWPQIFGPNRNGVSVEKGIAITWPEKGPPVLWQRKIGSGYGAPVVAGERLILFHRLEDKEVVECLNADHGQTIWKFAYATQYVDDYNKGDGPRSTPIIHGDRVITLGADGWLHCLDLHKGEKIWSKNILQEYRPPQSFFGVGSTPIIEKNMLLVNVGAKNAGVVAFHLDSGKEVWKASADGASYSSPVATSIQGKRLAVFLTRQGVLLLDPADGAVKYRQTFRARIEASVNAATPLLFEDLAFFSSSYDTGALVLRLRPDGADEVWNSKEALSNHYNTSVLYQGNLYGLDGRQEAGARLRCVELKTGKVRWSQENFRCCSFILAEGHLIGLTEKGDLVSVEATPDAFREKARAHVFNSLPCRSELALSNGRLFARDQENLACFDLKKK